MLLALASSPITLLSTACLQVIKDPEIEEFPEAMNGAHISAAYTDCRGASETAASDLQRPSQEVPPEDEQENPCITVRISNVDPETTVDDFQVSHHYTHGGKLVDHVSDTTHA